MRLSTTQLNHTVKELLAHRHIIVKYKGIIQSYNNSDFRHRYFESLTKSTLHAF